MNLDNGYIANSNLMIWSPAYNIMWKFRLKIDYKRNKVLIWKLKGSLKKIHNHYLKHLKQTTMKEFIVTYHAPAELMKSTNSTPEEMKKGMEAWMVWAEKCGDKLVSMGAPLMGGIKLSPDGSSTASNKNVVGYSILQAENMDDAKALMDGHPHLGWNAACDIEIHETMPLPG